MPVTRTALTRLGARQALLFIEYRCVVCDEIRRSIPSCLSVAERKASLLCWDALVCIAVINQSERESEVQVFIVRAKRIFVKTFHSINKKRELGNRNMMITKRFSIRKNVFLGKRRVVARSCGGCEGNRLRVINVFLFDCEKMWNDALMASLTRFGEEHSNTLE